MAYVANCKISGPRAVPAQAHVDFNGLQFSYVIGLMFPPTAVASRIPQSLPNQAQTYIPGS